MAGASSSGFGRDQRFQFWPKVTVPVLIGKNERLPSRSFTFSFTGPLPVLCRSFAGPLPFLYRSIDSGPLLYRSIDSDPLLYRSIHKEPFLYRSIHEEPFPDRSFLIKRLTRGGTGRFKERFRFIPEATERLKERLRLWPEIKPVQCWLGHLHEKICFASTESEPMTFQIMSSFLGITFLTSH